MKLPLDFYLRDDVTGIAMDLLGKVLVTKNKDVITSGIITETEAYAGITDRASHAWNDRRTSRTEIMYGKGGKAYVYLCYGIHSLFNIVTNSAGIPHAVLIRGIMPLNGIEEIFRRVNKNRLDYSNYNGPGKLTKALGIDLSDNGQDLLGERVWIEDQGFRILAENIIKGPRIGIDYAGEDALLPYRFYFNPDNPEGKFLSEGSF